MSSTHSQSRPTSSTSIKILKKHSYTICQKILCCRCFYCCQSTDKSLLTSSDRRFMFQRLAKDYMIDDHKQVRPFDMLMVLLLAGSSDLYTQMVERVSLVATSTGHDSKDDLQFYIPQLCTYLVFHDDMNNPELINLLEKSCKLTFHFAQRFYFYMKSLEKLDDMTQAIEAVQGYLGRLQKIMAEKWKIRSEQVGGALQEVAVRYQSRSGLKPELYEKISFINVDSMYDSIYGVNLPIVDNHYDSSISFIQDLVEISQKLRTKGGAKKDYLIEQLKKINLRLPARISLPFMKKNVRDMTVLNIVFEECKVFNTKERAPYYICLEVFHEPLDYLKTEQKEKQISRKRSRSQQIIEEQVLPKSVSNDTLHSERLTYVEDSQNASGIGKLTNKYKILDKFFRLTKQGKQKIFQHFQEEIDEAATSSNVVPSPKVITSNKENSVHAKLEQEMEEGRIGELFPETLEHKCKRISQYSPYSKLPKYQLITMVVKSNDNLKQEQFAIQLIKNFQEIFEEEKVNIRLNPYEIISTSYNSGIIEFLEDCLTIDELKRREASLEDVVIGKQRIKNFCRSLAGYSLITYLLQVKDRHNGNIMIARDGSLIHIDYGFFISNSPGKGVQIERNVPFKLPVEYVRVLGGLDSKYFQEFRKLFYQGFNAARKHQDRILLLVKLMYSSHGKTMPCFEKGEEAINELESRFNPAGIKTDIELSLYCQSLINSSIDNWRARWYDKWQYYAQGILY